MLSVQKDEKRGGGGGGIRWRIEARSQREGRFGFIPPALAESELRCYLNHVICIALFIPHCALVDNQSRLPPKERRSRVAV